MEINKVTGNGIHNSSQRIFCQGNGYGGVELWSDGTFRTVSVVDNRPMWLRRLDRMLAGWEKAQGWR